MTDGGLAGGRDGTAGLLLASCFSEEGAWHRAFGSTVYLDLGSFELICLYFYSYLVLETSYVGLISKRDQVSFQSEFIIKKRDHLVKMIS